MTIQDDETLQMYLEESIDHLADIETDLLAIEEAGADIDEDLVNKVYRAAHSIKGGAGFMGLTTIKDLTHEMENILGKIRSREMVPTPEIVNVLLGASDTLKELMNDVFTSNDVDISRHIDALQSIAEGKPLPGATVPAPAAPAGPVAEDDTQKTAPAGVATQSPDADTQMVSIASANADIAIDADRNLVEALIGEGKFVYLVSIDLAADVVAKGKQPASILEEMEQTGSLIASSIDPETIRTMDVSSEQAAASLIVLFATIIKPEDITILFEIPERHIHRVAEDMTAQCLGKEAPQPDAAAEGQPPEDAAQPVPEASVESDAAPATAPMEASSQAAPKKKTPTKTDTDTSLRVHVSLLDQLMTLAGELVLSRNQLLQSMGSEDHRGAEIAGQRIDLITSELQEAIMLTRMQSIGNVFNKFPRVVRDLSQSLGKNVELHLEGKDVELDKTIIEAIGDPLTHLVRNAVDHGIEMPDVRKRVGKSPAGTIYLKAYHEAGQVNIEISDDGKGLDGNVLTQKALEKGLITEDQAKIMSDKERISLIFLPGFSTAEKITDVSGRGVGMDVVKTNLDKLGGIIDIDSEKGKGSTIRIKLPLTLAIIPCQIVMAGFERYAIPQVNLEELLRIPASQVRDRIERVGDAEVVRLRGNLLPLIKLADVIETDSVYIDPKSGKKRLDRRKAIADRRSKKSTLTDPQETTDASSSPVDHDNRQLEDRRYHSASALNIVVVSTGAMKYGLVVDELHDSEEIVVKPLGRDLKKCKGYAGATIMGDGRVALILDVGNLAQMAGLASIEASSRAAEVAEENQRAIRDQKDRQSLLVFRSAENEQFAAPLNMVERIEKIKATDIEIVGGKRVIRYRAGSLPLFSVDEVAMVQPLADAKDLLVIVFILNGREIGLLAIGPVDAVELSLEVDGQTLRQAGIMGSAIINEHTTLMVDVYEMVQTLNPEWFEPMAAAANEDGEAAKILFAEDSNFFRNQVRSYMEDEGYSVIEAEDGAIAWDLLQEHADEISLVVTDIEMPNMDGFELTQRIKASNAYSHLPVIALTTLAGEEDIAKGREVGISDYQIKLDREKLVRSIYGFLTDN